MRFNGRLFLILVLAVAAGAGSASSVRAQDTTRQESAEQKAGPQTDTERLRAFIERQRIRLGEESAALDRVVADSGLVRMYADSLVAAREWVGLRGERPVLRITHNREAAASARINVLLAGGRTGLELSGQGQRIAVFDDGHPRLSHVELVGRIDRRDGFSVESTHATHVSATIAASGQWREVRGMAPAARIRSHDWSNDIIEMAEAALDGVLVSNHSYGDPVGWTPNIQGDGYWGWMGFPSLSATEDVLFGYYGATAAAWDEVADAAAHLVIVKSAGNERERQGPPDGAPHYVFEGGWRLSTQVRQPDGGPDGYDSIADAGVAKNVITVGAVEDIPWGVERPEDVVMTDFSSWGPVDDGRIKPDLVANGTSLMSAKSGGDEAYGASSGTSQAAPVVTGAAVLLQELWQREFPGHVPLSSTIKALLLHSADEAGPAPGPDYQFGWGHLNAERAALHLKQSADADRIFAPVRPYPAWVFEGSVAAGQTIEYVLSLPEGMPLRTTLVWTDPAAPVRELMLDDPSSQLVHDLDLVVGQDGVDHLPWVLDPFQPDAAASRGRNSRDNVEQVLFDAATGVLTVRVQAPASLSTAEQRFSLIVGSPLAAEDMSMTSLVSGTIRFGDAPLSGINVRLTGPASRGSTTGEDGVFMIDDLPSGTYSVEIDPSPFDITPSLSELVLPRDAGRLHVDVRSRMRTDAIRLFQSSRLLQSGEQAAAVDVQSVPAGGLLGVELTFTSHPQVDLGNAAVVLDTNFDPTVSPWSGVDAVRLADLALNQSIRATGDGRWRYRIPILWVDGQAPEGSEARVPFQIREGSTSGALVHADTLVIPVMGRDTLGPRALSSIRIEGVSHAAVGDDMEIHASFLDGSPVASVTADMVDRFDTTRVLTSFPMYDSGDIVADLDFVLGDGIYSARYFPSFEADFQLRVRAEDALGNVSHSLLPAFYSSSGFDGSGSILLLAESNGVSATNEHLAWLTSLGETPSWWERLVRGPIDPEVSGSFARVWMPRLSRPLERADDVAAARRALEQGAHLSLFSREVVRGEEATAWLHDATGIEVGTAVPVDWMRGAGSLAGLRLPYSGPAPRSLILPPGSEPLLTAGSHVLAARSGDTVISTVGYGSSTSPEANTLLLSAFLFEETGRVSSIPVPEPVSVRSGSILQAHSDSIQVVWEWQPWSTFTVEASLDSSFASVDQRETTVSDRIQIKDLVRGDVHFWRVRASNPAGDGPWSEVGRINTLPANQAPVALVARDSLLTGSGLGRTYFSYTAFFADPEGDDLTITMTVSDPRVVSLEELFGVDGKPTGVYLQPENPGTAVVYMRATDEEGLSAEASIDVIVAANTAPVIASWPDNPQYLTPGTVRRWSLDSLIDEADGDSLRFWFFNENPDVASAEISDGALEIEALIEGQTFIAFQVSDGRGAQVQETLVIRVRENTTPGRNPLVDVPEYLPGDSIALYLPVYFSDPDEDPISLELTDVSGGLEDVVVRGDTVFAFLSGSEDPVLTISVTDVFGARTDVDLPIIINAAAVVRTEDGRIPDRFETLASFPQPFSNRVTLPFTLPAPSRVRFDIYESLGRHVARVFDRSMQAGSHRLDWVPPAGLPGGNYYYQLRASGRVRTGILVFVP